MEKMLKRNIAKNIFILVFIYLLYLVIENFGDIQFQHWGRLLQLALLTVFSFVYKGNSKKVRVLFGLYVLLDFISGFSYFIRINAVENIFLVFPSSGWMFSIIFILKYLQWHLFKDVAATALLWLGYIFEYLSLYTTEPEEKTKATQKKITLSSVIAGINVLIFIWTVFVIFNNHWIDMAIPAIGSSLSYNQLYVVMIFYYLTSFGQWAIILAIIGLVAEKISKKKNYFGRIVNKTFLIFYLLMIVGDVIICESWGPHY
ncbi:MAG: hypothetical protein K6E51_04295 [Treponema sp.]|nr:hypothetical protein [Treponema sp.]